MLRPRTLLLRRALLLFSLLTLGVTASACDRETPDDRASEVETDADASDGRDTEDASATETEAPPIPRPRACTSSEQCHRDESCIASYDPGRWTAEAAVCVPGCIAAADPVRWCTDDASCCVFLSCDATYGFCDYATRHAPTQAGPRRPRLHPTR